MSAMSDVVRAYARALTAANVLGERLYAISISPDFAERLFSSIPAAGVFRRLFNLELEIDDLAEREVIFWCRRPEARLAAPTAIRETLEASIHAPAA